jgi:hypothetical protein
MLFDILGPRVYEGTILDLVFSVGAYAFFVFLGICIIGAIIAYAIDFYHRLFPKIPKTAAERVKAQIRVRH